MTHILGIIKPSNRPGRAEDLVAILPPGIEIIHSNLNIYRGSPEELTQAIAEYDPKIAELSARGAQLIHPAGAPPLLLGYAGEQDLIARWERSCGVPVFTNGSSQVNALRALGATSIVGVSYFPGPINASFARYYEEAGFDVLDMVGMDVAFQDVPKIPRAEIHEFVKAQFLRNASADAIYMLGPAWRTMDLIAGWEQEFGVPVVHHVPAQSWEMQRRFGIRHPVQGYGRLVADLPPLPA
jgi:maleate isomerase